MEPNSQTPPGPHAIGQSLVEYVRLNRQNAGILLSGLSILLLAVAVFLALKAFRTPDTGPPDKPLTADPLQDPDKPELPKLAPKNPAQGDYTVGWIGALMGCLVALAAGAWLMVTPGPAKDTAQRSEARQLLLAVGGLLGALLIVLGVAYFYLWSESLTKWLDTSETRELRWVLIPLMMVILGAGIVFLAIQPARAEERNNATVRRLVYGSNFALTILLLLVVLVVSNILIAIRVPNKLDATATGFYEFSEPTTRLLSNMKEPVTAYAVLPEEASRDISDMRQLLMAFQDASLGKFRVKFLSETTNRTDLNTLRAKYPQLDLTLSQRTVAGAILLTAGEDEKRHAVIPDTEFAAVQGNKQVFQGEARMFRELVILADTDTKPVVYFTQSNGEFSISATDEAPDDRKATRLKAYLEKNYLDVRPLTFARENPTVPTDAAVVVIVEPQTPISPEVAAAIRKYIAERKGKLLVLAGIVPGPGNAGVMKTGLEDMLKELNVLLGNRFVYNFPVDRESRPLQTIAGFTEASAKARNEVALSIAKAVRSLPMRLPREVATTTANPAFQAMPLLASLGVTWVEDDRIPDAKLVETIRQITRDQKYAFSRDLTDGNRSLAVLVSEKTTPVAAVYGNASFVSDVVGKQGSPDSAPITFDLIGVTIDWLRGRPSIAASGIEAKKYSEYQFPQPSTVDTTRLVWLPLGLTFLVVVGFGMGVWIVRRK